MSRSNAPSAAAQVDAFQFINYKEILLDQIDDLELSDQSNGGRNMEAIILVISWTLFAPPAHDVDVRTMPDIGSCLHAAKTVTQKISDLESRGVRAKLVARCISVPANIET